MAARETIAALITRYRDRIQDQWLRELASLTTVSPKARLAGQDISRQAKEFLDELTSAAGSAARTISVSRNGVASGRSSNSYPRSAFRLASLRMKLPALSSR